MAFSIYQASIPVYVRHLKALDLILDKATAYAAERKIEPAVLLQARLYPDMFSFARQVQIACGHAVRGTSRLSGREPPALDSKDTSFEELKALVAKALAIVEAVDPKAMDGAEDREIVFPVGDRKETLSGGEYLTGFSLPNFYFHVTTAYDILRHNGLPLGKGDFMGG